MGNRLTKIYTRTGDQGTTGLADGSRIDKDDLHIECCGTLDELNSAIGVVLAYAELPELLIPILSKIQNELFDLGSELCLPGYIAIEQHHVDFLEQSLDSLNAHLGPLKDFLLPGGHPAAAACHMARTICRRAERRMVSLAKRDRLTSLGMKYINRLSDLLFVLARYINYAFEYPEPLWQHVRIKKD